VLRGRVGGRRVELVAERAEAASLLSVSGRASGGGEWAGGVGVRGVARQGEIEMRRRAVQKPPAIASSDVRSASFLLSQKD